MKKYITRFLLSLSGAFLFVIGLAILLQPHAFFAASGITLGSDPNLLSEVRAPGGLLIGCAIVIFLGAIKQSITQHALILAAMVYGLFGISRLISIVFDGLPSSSIIGATAAELTIGVLCMLSLQRFKSNQSNSGAA